jgi:hypothetical protein
VSLLPELREGRGVRVVVPSFHARRREDEIDKGAGYHGFKTSFVHVALLYGIRGDEGIPGRSLCERKYKSAAGMHFCSSSPLVDGIYLLLHNEITRKRRRFARWSRKTDTKTVKEEMVA